VDRWTRNLFALVLVIVIGLTGGAALLLSGASPIAPGPPSDAATVDGVVVAVDARSLTDVRSFAVRTGDGRVLLFGLAELANGTQFPPGHLAEHQATATPVRVWYRDDGSSLEALYLEDAPVQAQPTAS
jgi:hypothetical protein